MTRRGFLGALATAVVGTCVATKIPTAWLPAPVRARAACEYMRAAYNAYTGGSRMVPGAMFVGRDLFEAYESELVACERFVFTAMPEHVRCLAFKGCPVVALNTGGWDFRFASHDEWRDMTRYLRG